MAQVAGKDAGAQVDIRLSRWSVELPELAQLLAKSEAKYTREDHSTQYLVFHTTRAFGAELGRLAKAQAERYRALARTEKTGRASNNRSADVYSSVLKRVTQHMAAQVPAV